MPLTWLRVKKLNRLIAWSLDRKIATNNVGITSLTSVLGIITGTDFGGPY